jgi:hypothetical protein
MKERSGEVKGRMERRSTTFEGENRKAKLFNCVAVFGESKRLGEDIGDLLNCRNMDKIDKVLGMRLVNIMVSRVDVLGARVLHIVLHMMAGGLRIGVQFDGSVDGVEDRRGELSEETCFLCSDRDGDIFAFH